MTTKTNQILQEVARRVKFYHGDEPVHEYDRIAFNLADQSDTREDYVLLAALAVLEVEDFDRRVSNG